MRNIKVSYPTASICRMSPVCIFSTLEIEDLIAEVSPVLAVAAGPPCPALLRLCARMSNFSDNLTW